MGFALILGIIGWCFMWIFFSLLPALAVGVFAFTLKQAGLYPARFLVPVAVLWGTITTVLLMEEAAGSPVYRTISQIVLVLGLLSYLGSVLVERKPEPGMLVFAFSLASLPAMKQVDFPPGFLGGILGPVLYMACYIVVPGGAAQFLGGLWSRFWRRNRYFWWDALGFAVSVGLMLLLRSHADALIEARGTHYVFLPWTLLTFLAAGFAFGMNWDADTDREALEKAEQERIHVGGPTPQAQTTAPPQPPGAETARQRGEQFEQHVVDQLKYLGDEFGWLSGIRVRGIGESEIDHLILGPNGFWVVEAKYRFGTIRVRNGMWQFRNGRTGELVTEESPGAQNEKHILDLKAFLRRHVGDTVDQITFHNAVCIPERTEWDGPDEFPGFIVRTPQALRMEIAHGTGTNPFPRDAYPGLAILLLRETVECQRRYLQRKGVPEPLPGLPRTAYDVLGVSPLATPEEVRERFRELSRRFHPDAAANASDERYKEISNAYTALSKNRKEYENEVLDEIEKVLRELYDILDAHGL